MCWLPVCCLKKHVSLWRKHISFSNNMHSCKNRKDTRQYPTIVKDVKIQLRCSTFWCGVQCLGLTMPLALVTSGSCMAWVGNQVDHQQHHAFPNNTHLLPVDAPQERARTSRTRFRNQSNPVRTSNHRLPMTVYSRTPSAQPTNPTKWIDRN